MQPITAYFGTNNYFKEFMLTGRGSQEPGFTEVSGIPFLETRWQADEVRQVAQAYAHRYQTGTNEFAYENDPRDIAESTMKKLAGTREEPRAGGVRLLREQIAEAERVGGQRLDRVPKLKEAISLIENGTALVPSEGGYLYTVELNVAPENLLDWDRPLAEQPKLLEAVKEHYSHYQHDGNGSELYHHIANYRADIHQMRPQENKWAASDFLARHGILGVRQEYQRISCYRARDYVGYDKPDSPQWLGIRMASGLVVAEAQTREEALQKIAAARTHRFTVFRPTAFRPEVIRIVNVEKMARTTVPSEINPYLSAPDNTALAAPKLS